MKPIVFRFLSLGLGDNNQYSFLPQFHKPPNIDTTTLQVALIKVNILKFEVSMLDSPSDFRCQMITSHFHKQLGINIMT